MPSLMMERGRQKLQNILEDGLGKDLMKAGRICFSCDQIFASRKFLEEHVCPAASHICSCGTEFALYEDMLFHSTTHEPGHQVLDHETIKKRRIEKCIEEEEKLKRIQSGDVVWKAPKGQCVSSISLPVKSTPKALVTSPRAPQKPVKSAQISQVPALYSSPSLLPNPIQSDPDMRNIFANVGAPTVDLWTLYQPVVMVQTVRKFNKNKPYTCGKCGEGFISKNSLICHHSSHVTDKVSGCIGCGLLLSSKKLVPRFHVCNSPSTATKFRLITARAQNSKPQRPRVTSSLQLNTKYSIVTSKGSQVPHVTSALQLKNQNLRTYGCSQGPKVSPSQQLKSQNPSASKPYVPPISLLSKSLSPNPVAFSKVSWGLPSSSPVLLKMSTPSVALTNPSQTSSAANGYKCRVCLISFDTAQLLQRHKCIKAREFMAQHGRGGRQRRVAPMASPTITQINGERKLGFPSSASMVKNQVVAVGLDKGQQGTVPINMKTADLDDDCYIIESGPDKPAEMIYQVTSSVPIKT